MVDVWQIPKCVSGLQGKIEQLAKQTRKPILFFNFSPCRHLLVQTQQWEHRNKV